MISKFFGIIQGIFEYPVGELVVSFGSKPIHGSAITGLVRILEGGINAVAMLEA